MVVLGAGAEIILFSLILWYVYQVFEYHAGSACLKSPFCALVVGGDVINGKHISIYWWMGTGWQSLLLFTPVQFSSP